MKRVGALFLPVLLLVATSALPARAEDAVSVAATLDRTSASLGDFLEYTIKVSAPPGTRTTVAGLASAFTAAGMETVGTTATVAQAMAALPHTTGTTVAGGPTAAPPMDLAPESEHTARAGEAEVTGRVWRVAAFKLGPVQLAGAEVQFRLPDGTSGSRPVPAVAIEISPIELPGNAKPPEGELFGVKPPVTMAAERRQHWGLFIAIVLLGLLVSLAIWNPSLLKRLLGLGPKPPPPPRPPDVVALDALDRLIAERLLDRGLAREYFGRLSEILRSYIDARFGLRSMEATTDELTPVLRCHPVLGEKWLEPLRKFMITCDLAKFARHVPPKAIGEDLTGFTRTLVRETRPEEDSEKTGPAPSTQEVAPS